MGFENVKVLIKKMKSENRPISLLAEISEFVFQIAYQAIGLKATRKTFGLP